MSILVDLHNLFIDKKYTVAVAESCTAGNIASSLTTMPSSSIYFKGGIVAYQKEIKTNILNVPIEIINEFTEVSSQTVREMATNILLQFRSDFSLATSGYAGPTGGTNKDPIGKVYMAVANSSEVVVERIVFTGDRNRIVKYATQKSLELLYMELKKK